MFFSKPQPPVPDDNIDFLYVLSKHGWSELLFYLDGKAQIIDITHIFDDPLANLIDFCCALIEGEKDIWVRLYDEPGATLLHVVRYPKMQHVAKVSFYFSYAGKEDAPPPGDKLLFCFDIKVSHFINLFYHQFSKLSELYREKSYQKDRAPFPEEKFLRLKELWPQYKGGNEAL